MAAEPVRSGSGDEVSQSFAPDAELANHGLYRQGGTWDYSRQEFLPQLRGRQAAKVYKEMALNDGIVGAILFSIEMVMRRVEWSVEPASAEDSGLSPEAVDEAALFVEGCLDDMSVPFESVLAEVLSMLQHGWAFLEVVYKRRMGPDQKDGSRRSSFEDGRLGIRKLVLVPQDTVLDWAMDDTGGVQAAIQQVTGYRVAIPIDKALMFRTSPSSPWGKSILRTAYVPWYYRKRVQEIEGVGIERDLVGLPVLYLHPEIMANPSKLTPYQDLIRNVRRDEQEGVILPAAYDESGNKMVSLELLSSGGARQFDTNAIIARYVREIAMSVLQDVILLGHEKVGTQALASIKRDLSDTALTAWLNEIASVFNRHLLPKLLRLNGMDLRTCPTLQPGEIRTSDLSALSSIILQLSQAGFALAGDAEMEDWVRRKFDFPERSDDPLDLTTDPTDSDQLPPTSPGAKADAAQSDATQEQTSSQGTPGVGGANPTTKPPALSQATPPTAVAKSRDPRGRFVRARP